MTADSEDFLAWKEKGNECVKEGKFEEAILHYSQAIKLDPSNATLYSNRSLAFLKLKQFYHAFMDAQETIKLKRDWAKGYFRKGEVEINAGRPSDALLSYQIALRLQPSDEAITNAVSRAADACQKEKRKEQIPWVCAGIGIVIGVAIVMGDQLLTVKPSVSHPLLMALLTISIATVAYFLARAWKFYVGCQLHSLLEPPFDLLADMNRNCKESEPQEQDKPAERTYTRLSKAQTRAKLKKHRTEM